MRTTTTRQLVAALCIACASFVNATCTTEVGIDYAGHDIATVPNISSYGECCDACIQHAGCDYWTLDGNTQPSGATSNCYLKTSPAGRANGTNHWSGWAGTGPAPTPGPAPIPPPAAGKWGAPIYDIQCNAPIKDLGKGIALADCKAACAASDKCYFINHADKSDKHCVLFAECTKPTCRGGSPGNGWTLYEYGRSGGAPPFTPCVQPRPGPPGPSPPGPSPAGDPNGFDCKVRLLALEYARTVLNVTTGAPEAAMVATSLGLDLPSGITCLPKQAKTASVTTAATTTTTAASTTVASTTAATTTAATTATPASTRMTSSIAGRLSQIGTAATGGTFYVDQVLRYCTHTVHILYTYCCYRGYILCRPGTQILYSYCTHTVCILYAYCTHTVRIYHTHTVHILYAYTIRILYSYCTHVLYAYTALILYSYHTHAVL
jgi:hypothetical protein